MNKFIICKTPYALKWKKRDIWIHSWWNIFSSVWQWVIFSSRQELESGCQALDQSGQSHNHLNILLSIWLGQKAYLNKIFKVITIHKDILLNSDGGLLNWVSEPSTIIVQQDKQNEYRVTGNLNISFA